MFERFTASGRQAVVLAQDEARRLMHGYVGSEHLLLGLLREQQGLAAEVLESLGITLTSARRQVERTVGTGEEPSPSQIPFTPRTKKILELSLREALSLDHNYIGTEHVLLALVRVNEGVACRTLLQFDADDVMVRNAVIQRLPGTEARPRAQVSERGIAPPVDSGWLDGLPDVLAPLGAEIRSQLGRAPDVGDLLIACACVPHTPAYRALGKLGVDIDQLRGEIEHARARDEERDQTRARHRAQRAALGELRRRLGLGGAGEP